MQKRSKLVLPSPQISDGELENLIKVGQANENALRLAMEEMGTGGGASTGATSALLSDLCQGSSATPALENLRTPLAPKDSLIQEAQNILALQQTQTPLKGGDNAILTENALKFKLNDKESAPIAQTPNVVLAGQILGTTPFRTPGVAGQGASATPMSVQSGKAFDSTPMTEDDGSDLLRKESLKSGLMSLPKPKNNFEIFVPEDEKSEANESMAEDSSAVGNVDQAEIDRQKAEEKAEAEKIEWSKRSQALQRELPRPKEINHNIMRTSGVQTEIQKAEEVIKSEMLTMLHYDAMKNPPPLFLADLQKPHDGKVLGPQTIQKRINSANSSHDAYLKQHTYDMFEVEEIDDAKSLVEKEMHVVKQYMNHGELSLESYCKVWDECLAQVLYLPAHKRFTRASVASKRDIIESAEKQLQTYRSLMTEEAKKAAKLEKKLRVLLGGYQSRSQNLVKAMQETVDQIEQSEIEYQTLLRLREQETGAIVHRIDILEADVQRQKKREEELQERYGQLMREKEELSTPETTVTNGTTEHDAKDPADLGGWVQETNLVQEQPVN